MHWSLSSKRKNGYKSGLMPVTCFLMYRKRDFHSYYNVFVLFFHEFHYKLFYFGSMNTNVRCSITNTCPSLYFCNLFITGM
jgi:hypothetical protein